MTITMTSSNVVDDCLLNSSLSDLILSNLWEHDTEFDTVEML